MAGQEMQGDDGKATGRKGKVSKGRGDGDCPVITVGNGDCMEKYCFTGHQQQQGWSEHVSKQS